MTLDPILAAPLAVQIHVLTVVPAFALGGWMLWARKGTALHKALGRIWLMLMVVTALSSFFIHEIRMVGDFSPIHLLSILTLASCFNIIRTARKRQFSAHRRTVLALYWGGIGLAGAFMVAPGRIMNRAIFDGANAWPAVIAAAVLCVAVLVYVNRKGLVAGKAMATVVVASTLPALLAERAEAAQPGAGDIISRTPLWVWPLLAALLVMGWMHSRDRVVAKARLLVQPLVFAGIGMANFVLNGPSAIAATALLLALSAGAMAGQALGRRDGATVDASGKVHVPGEWVSMGLILVIFASRFAGGAAQGIDPALAGTAAIAVPMAVVSGFTVGLTGMRALVQTGLRA